MPDRLESDVVENFDGPFECSHYEAYFFDISDAGYFFAFFAVVVFWGGVGGGGGVEAGEVA